MRVWSREGSDAQFGDCGTCGKGYRRTQACVPGAYNAVGSPSACAHSARGTFQGETTHQSDACETCPDGYMTQGDDGNLSEEGATLCKACPSGWWDVDHFAHDGCELCGPGSVVEAASAALTCTKCAAGKYEASDTECKNCAEGRWAAQGEGVDAACGPCPDAAEPAAAL